LIHTYFVSVVGVEGSLLLRYADDVRVSGVLFEVLLVVVGRGDTS
jgi:hypothetical protein